MTPVCRSRATPRSFSSSAASRARAATTSPPRPGSPNARSGGFRTKESCVDPLFSASHRGFLEKLKRWPREATIEAHLRECFRLDAKTQQEIADEVLIVRLIAVMPEEPDLRSVWLMSCQETEDALIAIVADRLDRSVKDFDVRLCAATMVAAIRIVDETISVAAIRHKQTFTLEDVVEQMAKAIRAASTLPICDPVIPNVFGGRP
ncbi:hypothetical protein [Chenggangzhangella methanolivorans]|uniref:MftR C-terminal domain-containing protein n=1 Tax=Chenggangzhangella methanolivorans TaxID=1437009 RepID=A0A9E6UGP9_9HYPH|nr:hypothetical protein [Chenggangzhangella methanolivorans]QZN98967.1 hypothetical protein K6K41_19000 [Chenggangzhangella methanolivorans]